MMKEKATKEFGTVVTNQVIVIQHFFSPHQGRVTILGLV